MKRRRRHRASPETTPDLFEYVAPIPSYPARASDPEPSHASAKRVAVKNVRRFSAKTRQAKLLIEFDAAGAHGLTDDEATHRVIPLEFVTHFNGCRRRCSDLRAAGFIEHAHDAEGNLIKRRNPGSPDESAVSRITEAGRDAITRLFSTGWSQ
jgi:hypothetical protein